MIVIFTNDSRCLPSLTTDPELLLGTRGNGGQSIKMDDWDIDDMLHEEEDMRMAQEAEVSRW